MIFDNPDKLTILGTPVDGKQKDKEKTQHNMCQTQLYANKHK